MKKIFLCILFVLLSVSTAFSKSVEKFIEVREFFTRLQ